MSLTTWVVQENMSPTREVGTLGIMAAACLEAARPVIRVKVIPFSLSLPEMPETEWPFVIYGSTTMIANAAASRRWHAGVFYDEHLMRPSEYALRFGELYLNDDTEVMTHEALACRRAGADEPLFLRPNDDLKQWTGQVMTFGEYLTWYSNFDDEMKCTTVAICSPKLIDAEWRLVIVDGRVAGGSQYRPQAAPSVPSDVEEFALRAARRWCPTPVVVIDIAHARNDLKVLELNCFNGSGLYSADVRQIVLSVSQYVESLSLDERMRWRVH